MSELDVDPRAVALLNAFMQALSLPDPLESARAVLPFVHRSLKTAAGDDLSRDLRQFGHKKAHGNARHYAIPVHVTRVRTTRTTGIGFEDTAEPGRVDDYFITKRDGVNGMPAPVKIFFPADGGPPLVSYMGSL